MKMLIIQDVWITFHSFSTRKLYILEPIFGKYIKKVFGHHSLLLKSLHIYSKHFITEHAKFNISSSWNSYSFQ